MGSRPSGNVTGGRSTGGPSLPLGHAGGPTRGIGGVERFYKVHGEPETASQAARLQSPSVKLHTALGPVEAMSRALVALARAGFDTVSWFNGGIEDTSPDRKEGMHVRDVVSAMGALDRPHVPFFGLRAVLRYRRDERVTAVVRVGRTRPAKVRVKVRGAVYKSDWHGLKRLFDRRLEDIDRDD